MKRILLITLFIPYLLFSQGKLEKAKKSLSETSTTSKSFSIDRSTRTSRSNNRNSIDNDGFFTEFFVKLGYYAIYGSVVDKAENRSLTPYPYFENLNGEYLKGDFKGAKHQLFKFGINQMFDNGLKGLELNANYRVLPILGVEASHLGFSESSIKGKQYLDVSSVMVNYYRIREQQISMWWGLGVTYVGNNVDTFGFAYNFGSEIYPFKPVSLAVKYKQSFVNSTSVNEFQLHLKYHIQKTALFTGYHANKLGSEPVKGLVFGAEYTF